MNHGPPDWRKEDVMDHKCVEFRWALATNEDGWICTECGAKIADAEPDGYSPLMDKSNILTKVEDILHHLHEEDFIYISNGSEGMVLSAMVVNRCYNENRYDQYSIIDFIYDLERPEHADYWRKIGMAIREGHDPRDRCDACPKLANCWTGNRKSCSEHADLLDAKTETEVSR